MQESVHVRRPHRDRAREIGRGRQLTAGRHSYPAAPEVPSWNRGGAAMPAGSSSREGEGRGIRCVKARAAARAWGVPEDALPVPFVRRRASLPRRWHVAAAANTPFQTGHTAPEPPGGGRSTSLSTIGGYLKDGHLSVDTCHFLLARKLRGCVDGCGAAFRRRAGPICRRRNRQQRCRLLHCVPHRGRVPPRRSEPRRRRTERGEPKWGSNWRWSSTPT